MTASDHFDFTHLTIAERILLAQELLESICPRTGDHPMSAAERQEIERRWAAFEAGRMNASSWEEVRQRVFGQ
jgi:putative addiction module component (TIGR02574 family)